MVCQEQLADLQHQLQAGVQVQNQPLDASFMATATLALEDVNFWLEILLGF